MVNTFVLRSYRELCKLIRRLPTEVEQHAARVQAQSGMRKHAEANEEQVADLHRVLVGKISFLRMRVPRLPRDAGRVGVGHFVVREGKVVEGAGESPATRRAVQTPI